MKLVVPSSERIFFMRRIVFLAAVVAVCFARAANAAVITFDDLVSEGSTVIPNGYGGLNWENAFFKTISGPTDQVWNSGFAHGVTSGMTVAYNGNASIATAE